MKICCGYSLELSYWDPSSEYTQDVFSFTNKDFVPPSNSRATTDQFITRSGREPIQGFPHINIITEIIAT